MKKLKCLNIIFETHDEFMHDIYQILNNSESKHVDPNSNISFDTYETYKRLITSNRLEIIMAIARFKPESINQLAKMVKREFPHVHKDCHALESYGFIHLEEVEGRRKQLKPCLTFDYDVIQVHGEIKELIAISEASNRVLEQAMSL
jgi:predicted transcriptional regulator